MPSHVKKKRRLDAESSPSPSSSLQTTNADIPVEFESDSRLTALSPGDVSPNLPDHQDLAQPTFKPVVSHDQVLETQAAASKTGVIYLSRIPPRLSPTKIRQLLSPFGSSVLRVFLAPESTIMYDRRVKSGGSKRDGFWKVGLNLRTKKLLKGLLNC